MISGLGQLPITLTCSPWTWDEIYAQYSNELWPNDPNFTIGSMLRLFCAFEVAPIVESKLLFEEPP